MGVTDDLVDDTNIPPIAPRTLQIPRIGRKVKTCFGCCAPSACVEAG